MQQSQVFTPMNSHYLQVPLDTKVGASSALSAVEFSRTISRGPREGLEGDNAQCCGEGDGSCQTISDRFVFSFI